MTTIAYDGKTVATDRRCYDGHFMSKAQKLYRLSDGSLYAGAGRYSDLIAVRDWLDAGAPEDMLPPICEDEGSVYMHIKTDGCVLYESSLVPMPIIPPYAVGSGSTAAMTAMVCFKATASKAVECAAQIDPLTGDGVDSLPVPKAAKVRKVAA
jgi:hypothetical protein